MMSRWPQDARCVVNITVDFDGLSNETGKKLLPIGKYSHGRYSAKRGVPRFLELFRRLGIKATFYVPGYDAECFPAAVRSLLVTLWVVGVACHRCQWGQLWRW